MKKSQNYNYELFDKNSSRKNRRFKGSNDTDVTIREIAERLGMSKEDVGTIILLFFESVVNKTFKNGSFLIPKIGKFWISEKNLNLSLTGVYRKTKTFRFTRSDCIRDFIREIERGDRL